MAKMFNSCILILLFLNSVTTDSGSNKQNQDDSFLKASVNVPFIVNGWTAARGRWPWQASLRRWSSTYKVWYHTCGAIVLSEKFVMSAAHCTQDLTSSYRVVLGGHDILDDNDGYITYIRRIYNHPQYSSISPRNDISIVELNSPAVFNQYVRPAALPDTEDSFVGASCYITGWGKTSGVTGTSPRYLQEATIPVITNSKCRYRMRNVRGVYIYDSNICVYDAIRSSCQGDSGGPLHCRRGGQDEWVVTGVTSFGVGNDHDTCRYSFPSVYTRTSSFVPWIRGIVGDELRFPDRNSTGVCQTTTTQTTTTTNNTTTTTQRPRDLPGPIGGASFIYSLPLLFSSIFVVLCV